MAEKLFLIIGPSGVGKGTMLSMLRERHSEFVFPLSVTTRKKRLGEKEGEIYNFVTQEQFDNHLKNNDLLEWAVVHKTDRYGILKKEVFDAFKEGKTVVREVDVQGWKSILKTEIAEKTVSIFIMPPSLENLKQRIIKRAPISDDELETRLLDAEMEIKKGVDCDYHPISDENEQEKLYEEIESIIMQEMEK